MFGVDSNFDRNAARPGHIALGIRDCDGERLIVSIAILGYVAAVSENDLTDDPLEQLRQAVVAVFESWNTPRAVAYRVREKIGLRYPADDVTV